MTSKASVLRARTIKCTRWKFSNVRFLFQLLYELTAALTFENFCQGYASKADQELTQLQGHLYKLKNYSRDLHAGRRSHSIRTPTNRRAAVFGDLDSQVVTDSIIDWQLRFFKMDGFELSYAQDGMEGVVCRVLKLRNLQQVQVD